MNSTGRRNKTWRGQPVKSLEQSRADKLAWQRNYNQVRHREFKRQVFEAYGNDCSCCGESELKFLSVDHVNGGGGEHRRAVGGGTAVLAEIVRRNFPEEFTVLCFNCNLGRQWNGGICPHRS